MREGLIILGCLFVYAIIFLIFLRMTIGTWNKDDTGNKSSNNDDDTNYKSSHR